MNVSNVFENCKGFLSLLYVLDTCQLSEPFFLAGHAPVGISGKINADWDQRTNFVIIEYLQIFLVSYAPSVATAVSVEVAAFGDFSVFAKACSTSSLNCGEYQHLSSVMATVLSSENHAAAVLSLPLSVKIQSSPIILFWNAEYVGAFSLPTIVSARYCNCIYLMFVAFLSRNATAKHVFEKTNGRPTFPQFSSSTPCVRIA